jgi:hypothetical protein
MKQIIKGAIYTDGDELLRPHYSGNFSAVDCTEYKTKSQIKQEYDKKTAKVMLSNLCLTYEGEKYYECECNPFHTDNMDLLSDLSELEYFDEETDF